MKKLLFNLAFVILYISVFAQPGSLDSSFGDNGTVISSNPKGQNFPVASTVLKNNKIVVFSDYSSVNNIKRYVSQYLPNGMTDSSFGVNGIFQFKDPLFLNSITVQQDDKIVLAGGSDISGLTLARINSDGTIDEGFGNGGVYVGSVGGQRASDVAVQRDGKIVVCGTSIKDPELEIVNPFLAQFNADGSLDESFGEGGIIILDTSLFIPSSIVVQSDGKIVCSGHRGLYGSLMRFNSNGIIDSAFGTKGQVNTRFSKVADSFNDIILQPDEKIVVVGTAGDGNFEIENPYICLARYDQNGALDNTFGLEGKVSVKIPRYAFGESIVLQSNKKIVVGGWSVSESSDFSVVRLLENGLLDSSFGLNGIVLTHIGSIVDNQTYQIGLQTSGRIIVSGLLNPGNNDYSSALAGYIGDNIKQRGPIAKKIIRWIRNHTLYWQPVDSDVAYYSIEKSGTAGFKSIAKIKATASSRNAVYSYDLPAQANNVTDSYRITAINQNGINITSDIITLGNNQSVTISPNPAKDVLKVSGLPITQKATIEVVNRNGSSLIKAVSNSENYNLNLSSLKSGIYSLVVSIENKIQTINFVKE